MNAQSGGNISRRDFAALLGAAVMSPARAQETENAGRRLDFKFDGDFGDAQTADIEAVLRSAAESIWRHCPDTRWEVPGFLIYHNEAYPIVLDDHRDNGRIAIGLTSRGRLWSQFAFQFAHEFCHALAGHSNDWRKLHRGGARPNHWLEESICEAASLFALRAMGNSWKTAPPYPNWKSYAAHLTEYAGKRMQESSTALAKERSFEAWFAANEASMRENATQREKNNIVAMQLLPLFEAEPRGWEAVTFVNRAAPSPGQTLASHFAAWAAETPVPLRAFVDRIAAMLQPAGAT